jgi:WD40 repeat protein/serine/threonine protein kinase
LRGLARACDSAALGQEEAKILAAFRDRFAYDRGLRRLRPVAHYQRLFRGYEETIEREYTRLESEAPTPATATTPAPVVELVESPQPAPEESERRVGPYRLLREIGRGGQATVHLAEDTRLPRRVALKVFATGLMASEQALARFRREAESASRLDHPGICPVYEAGVDGDTPYIAMRYIEGMTLAQWIDTARAKSGDDRPTSSVELPTPPASPRGESASVVMRVVAVIEKTARALHAAHDAGLVHRDVKPANVVVSRDGEPVLLDFGLAREDDQGHTLTMTGALLGTPAYMSPEQLLAPRIRVDHRTDVYSLGVTLYECLTLRRPFDAPTREGLYQQILSSDADSPRRLNPKIPEELVVVLETAMAKNRDRRYRTALEMAEDLRRLREHEPIHAKPAGTLVRLARWAQRRPALATAVGAVATLLVLGLAFTTYFLQRSREEQGRTAKALDERTEALAAANQATRRAESETQAKSEALAAETKALQHARYLALMSASMAAESADGMRPLLLAREAVRTEPSVAAFSQLRRAIYNSRERVVFRGHTDLLDKAVFSPGGDRIVTCSHDTTARLWDLSGQPIAVLRGHTGQVMTVAFSPDGGRIVTASIDGTARLWSSSGEEIAVLRGHTGPVVTAVFSPDGDRILTASKDATARLWDLSGAERVVMRGHSAGLAMATFSPQGDRVLTASDDATARLFDVTGRQIAVLSGHQRAVWSARFSPAGDRIATSSDDATARLWDLSGKELTVLRGHESLVGDVEFSPQGDRLLTLSWDRTVRVWDLAGKQLVSIWCGSPPTTATYSPRGDRILTTAYDGTARIWDVSGRELAVFRGHEGNVNGAVFSARGDQILTCGNDGTARLWDVDRKEAAALIGHGGIVHTAVFSPLGDRILTSSDDKTARLWDVAGGERAVLSGHEGRVWSAAFSTDGARIVTVSGDCTARLWTASGDPGPVLRGHAVPVRLAEFIPGGDRVLTVSRNEQAGERTPDDHDARLWDLAGNQVALLHGHSACVYRAMLSPAGDRIVTASFDHTAGIWDLAGNRLAVLEAGGDSTMAATWSPGGDRIVTGNQDSTVRLWDSSGNQVTELRGCNAGISTASFSPQGDRILATTWSGSSWIWDLAGREIAVLRGHDGGVCAGAFSPQGDRIATASEDHTARIWDSAGNELAVLPHEGTVLTVCFSPDGRRLVTACEDGTARVWLVQNEDVLALAEARTTRELTRAERERYADILGPENAALLQAQDAIPRLELGTLLVSELLARIDADTALTDGARAAARRIASERKDDPNAINRATWDVIRVPGRAADDYALAARRLGVAAKLAPEDGNVVNSFGVAQYRAGSYADALATLVRSDEINARSKPPGIAEDVAFLAMCHHRLGNAAAAHASLLRLRELVKRVAPAAGSDATQFAREAEDLAGRD